MTTSMAEQCPRCGGPREFHPGVCLGVKISDEELTVFPDSLEELFGGKGIDLERAMRDLITEGSVRAMVCNCRNLDWHYHFVGEVARSLVRASQQVKRAKRD